MRQKFSRYSAAKNILFENYLKNSISVRGHCNYINTVIPCYFLNKTISYFSENDNFD